MQLLINYFRLRFKTALIYIIPTVSNLCGQALQMILLFFFWTQVYHADVYTIQYVMWSRVIFGVIGNNSVWGLAEEIKNGNVSIRLTKPIGYFRHTYIAHLAMQLVNIFFVCIPLAITAYIISPIRISIIQTLICIVSIILSVTICYCFDYIISLLCIFTHNTWGISALRDGVVQILSGSIVPLYLFPDNIKNIINCFPFTYMIDTPVNVLINYNVNYKVFMIQLGYCGIMILSALLMEKLFLRRIQIQGG